MFINTGRKKANIVMGLREIEKTSKIKKKKKNPNPSASLVILLTADPAPSPSTGDSGRRAFLGPQLWRHDLGKFSQLLQTEESRPGTYQPGVEGWGDNWRRF